MKTTPYIMIAAMSCAAAQAQVADTTLTQSLTIERAYSPVIKEANKIDRQPAVETVQVTHTEATFADLKSQSVRPNEITDMNVGQVIVTPEPEESGYVDLSFGNYWNTDLKAGYKKGEFSVDANGYFTSGALKTPYPQYIEKHYAEGSLVQLNDSAGKGTWNSLLGKGAINGRYEHFFDNMSQIKANAYFEGAFADGMNYTIEVPEVYDQETQERLFNIYQCKQDSRRQHWGRFGFDAEYVADRYDVKVGYEHVGIKYPDNYENIIAMSGNLLAYQNDQWLVTAGLNSEIIFGKEGSHFTFKPEAEVSFLPDSRSWRRLYAKWGLGTRRESLYELMDKLPLFYMTDYDNSFDALDLTFGWEDSEMGWLKYGVSANLRYTKNDVNALMTSNHFFVPSMLDDSNTIVLAGINETKFDGTYALLANEDCFSFDLEAHLDYEFNRYFGAKAQLLYHYENCKLQGFGDPNYIANLHLLANVRKVKMDLGFEGAFDRSMNLISTNVIEMHAFETTLHEIDLGNIANLNFRVDYQHNRDLGFYAFANNILNHKYQLWSTVPAQGINVHVGFNWKF